MNVEITARHGRVGKRLKDHASDRTDQVLRFADGITSVHWILGEEKERACAEVIVHGRNLATTVSAESGDMWASIDACAEKLRHAIEHRTGKAKERRRRGEKLSLLDAEMAARAVAVEPEPEEEEIRVIRGKARKPKSLSLAEARNELEDSKSEHVLFRDSKNDRFFVLYRRRDGQLGLIDTGVE
jgi:putative sigma-54 modulation protein